MSTVGRFQAIFEMSDGPGNVGKNSDVACQKARFSRIVYFALRRYLVAASRWAAMSLENW